MSESIELIWTKPAPPRRQRQLGREEIVAAAIDLADEAGPQGLTMKALAARLGPYTPMALYRYVHNKEGLIDLMLDTAAGEVGYPDRPTGDWRDDLHTLAAEMRRMTQRHPWFAQLVHTRPPAGPRMMRRTEFMLTVLTGEGLTLPLAMTYAALIDRHVVGSGQQDAEEAGFERAYGLDDPGSLLVALGIVRRLAVEAELPHLAEWLGDPSGPSADERFELGLTFLLDGIAARLPDRRSVR